MQINVRYIDTCLPCYLQDHHNRVGECLLSTSLGVTPEQAFDNLVNDVDIPDWVDQDEVAAAVKDALAGVDLRYIDERGNRCDEVPEYRDDEEPRAFFVLTTPAKQVKLTMTVDALYLVFDEDTDEAKYRLKLLLEDTIRQAYNNGALTGGLNAEVISVGMTASPED